MIRLTLNQTTTLKHWFLPDRPGPLIGLHVIHTGNGHCWADRWPNPRAVLVETAGNYSLAGDPNALTPAGLRPHISGVVETPEPFVSLLWAAFPNAVVWDRVILALHGKPHFSLPPDTLIRRLDPADSVQLEGLSEESGWIGKTWGGPAGLGASGYAWGAFAGDRLISVACPFFVGQRYEDLGVVTELEYRGLGLSAACAGAVCQDILDRGRQASWTTSLDNLASLRVAEKLGFSIQRYDCLYVIGITIPEPSSH
ncbi:MAG: GNAT family N-acetyltransferase [Chloroflexi bacterium]|nr:GNAT family N-acetyltransferase [Chloroflexota bacterium]